MSSGHADSFGRRFRAALAGLFGEAWELESRRQRRRSMLFVLCLGGVAAVSVSALRPNGAGSMGGSGRSGRATVVTSRLPLSTDFTGLSAVNGQLILTANGTSAINAVGGGRCATAVVNPDTLRLGSTERGPCDDPALFHRRVIEVDQYTRGSGEIRVRTATVAPRTRAGYSLGPTLFTYQQCSDCWEVSVYGPTALWIYAPFSTVGFKPDGELFRISEQTGQVLERWAMPSITRPLVATDADGLWITPSVDGGGPGVLYHVAPGARAPSRSLSYASPSSPDGSALFLIASGHAVWVAVSRGPRSSQARLWRLDGAKVVEHGRTVVDGQQCIDSGEGPPTVLPSSTTSFYCVATGDWENGEGASTQDIVHVLPSLSQEQRVATVRPPPETWDVNAAATLDGSYYFLDPSTQTQGQPDEFYGSTTQPTPTYTHAAVLARYGPT